MAEPIIQVDLTLQTSTGSRAGFGTPCFIGAHRWFNERIKSFTKTSFQEAFPTDSQEYAACTAAFASTPTLVNVKVGRREADITLDFPETPAVGDLYKFTIKDTDGDTLLVSYTAGALDDEEAVVDALKGLIDGNANIAAHVTTTKNGTGATTTLTLSATASTDTYSLTGLSGLIYSHATLETLVQAYTAVKKIDKDFYFITSHDHTETSVLALAATVTAEDRQYFYSTQEQGALAVLSDPPTDTAGKLEDLNYLNTVGFFSETADTTFPELYFIGKVAPATPGTVTWALNELNLPVASDPSTGINVDETQEDNLLARNLNYVKDFGGLNISWPGTTVSGNWIDEVRIIHFLKARITEAYRDYLVAQGKVPMTVSGINSARSVLTSVLDRYVSTESQPNILQENNPYTTVFPRPIDISFQDKANRTLNASFTAYLAGAVHIIKITGNLTLPTA